MKTEDISGYAYQSAEKNHSHNYLLPSVIGILGEVQKASGCQKRLFEVGCGNGSVAASLATGGWSVTGVDPSEQGIQFAQEAYPDIDLNRGSAYDDLAGQYGQFPAVLSLEVVEHVYDPRRYAATVFSLLESGGYAVVSTP